MLYVMLFCTYPFERPEDERETPTKKYQTVSYLPSPWRCFPSVSFTLAASCAAHIARSYKLPNVDAGVFCQVGFMLRGLDCNAGAAAGDQGGLCVSSKYPHLR